jgi:hypothetical protein
MMTPPPVSRDAYPVIVGSEMRSNYLSGGLVFTSAYVDNLMGVSSSPVSDETYSFFPAISFDRRTPRQGESLNYSPGFNLYQHTSELNGISQSGSAGYRFHMSPYAVVVLQNSFNQNYNLYNQGNPFSGNGISGTPGSPNTVPIAPFQNQLSNSSSAGIDYQYGRNAMIGGTGNYSFVHYSDVAKASGLNDANTTGASAFYSRRIGRSEYVGAVYQFSKNITHPIDTYSVTNAVFGFYTHYFTRSFSVSVLGGPEHYTIWSPMVPQEGSWTPAVQGSFGWQGLRSSISAYYSYIVSGAVGLIGTYKSNLGGLNGRLLLSRTWSVSANAAYSNFNDVNSSLAVPGFGSGGRTISGEFSVEHRIAERLRGIAGYEHIHEDYSGVPAVASFPNSNRVFFSISYSYQRPIGR